MTFNKGIFFVNEQVCVDGGGGLTGKFGMFFVQLDSRKWFLQYTLFNEDYLSEPTVNWKLREPFSGHT